MTTPSGIAAGRPQPQTTVEQPGGPFIRHSIAGRRAMYVSSATAFSGLINNPLVAAPGYTRGFRVLTSAGSGSGVATVATTADSPFAVYSLIQLKDSFGTPLIVAPGYEGTNLIQLFSGQYGLEENSNPLNIGQTYSPVSTGAGSSGNFVYSTYLPLEFAKAYGVISSANASLLPTLQFNLGAASAVYTTAPTTNPTITTTVDQDFYWLPEGVSVEPPGLGTTCQWIYQPANPTIGSAGSLNVQLPRLGGFLTTIIGELRDSAGARTTTGSGSNGGWGSRIRFLVDGVPLVDSLLTTIYEDMSITWPGYGMQNNALGGTAPTTGSAGGIVQVGGVIAFSYKNGLSQQQFGLLDTGEAYLSTNPGTQLEFACAPWGGVASGPMTLNALCGQVVPSGALIQGLPEV